MNPVRTAGSNSIYRGHPPEVQDAWVRRERAAGVVYMVWELSPEERAAIAGGANLRLGIHQEPIPPVELECTEERALTELGAALRDRALEALAHAPGPEDEPERPGWWTMSPDVWAAFEHEQALDPPDGSGSPTLLGRPLLLSEAHGPEWLTLTLPSREEAQA